MIVDLARSSIRALVHSYRIAAVSILLLALGIAANVVLFAVSDAVMFRPFPFVAQDRLVIAAEYLTGAPRAEVLNLGRRSDTWSTVVGIVADIRYREIGATPLDVYVPFAQSWFPVGDLMIRTMVPPATVAATVRTRLRHVDPDGIIDIVPMDRVVEAQEAPWRTNLLLFGVFAVLTVLVAVVGLFAMLAATVVEQSREIGVRAALGATGARIMREVLGQGMQTVVPGVLVGVVAFLACSRLIRSLLFEVSPVDRVTLVGAASALVTIAIVACAVPAFRAARVDPAVCLRSE